MQRDRRNEIEIFDSLRAGLRVEGIDFKDADTPRLIDRENAYWQRLINGLEADLSDDRRLCNQLRVRRRQVLSGQYRRRSEPGLPQFAMGIAAGAVLFSSVGMWWGLSGGEPGTEVTRTASIETMNIDNAEFSNNIDFYTWLEEQNGIVADLGDD